MKLVPRYSGRIPLEQIPWWEDLKEVSRLYRWLELLERTPEDPAAFILDAQAYEFEYEQMLCWTGASA